MRCRVFVAVFLVFLICLLIPGEAWALSVAPDFAGGRGTADNPYLIETPGQLALLGELVGQDAGNYNVLHYKLTADLDLSAYRDGVGWLPIGAQTSGGENLRRGFGGYFDGDGHTISNLYVTGLSYAGLFSYLDKGSIVNLTIENAEVRDCAISGILVGYVDRGKIENCTVQGQVIGISNYLGGLAGYLCGAEIKNCRAVDCQVEGHSFVGGFTGYLGGNSLASIFILHNSTVEDSHASGTVTAADTQAGGFAGYIRSSVLSDCGAAVEVGAPAREVGGFAGSVGFEVRLIDCFATGDVTGQDYTGGLIGRLDGKTTANESIPYAPESESRIFGCYATGNVQGQQFTGGLIGNIEKQFYLRDSYATGQVQGTNCVGGLVGEARYLEEFNRCYATGEVSGEKYVGGLVGFLTTGAMPLENSYAQNSVSGQSRVGGLVGYCSGVDIRGCYTYTQVFGCGGRGRGPDRQCPQLHD